MKMVFPTGIYMCVCMECGCVCSSWLPNDTTNCAHLFRINMHNLVKGEHRTEAPITHTLFWHYYISTYIYDPRPHTHSLLKWVNTLQHPETPARTFSAQHPRRTNAYSFCPLSPPLAIDPDYKLKSAAQTPATLHHAGSNSHPNEHQLHHHPMNQQLPDAMMMMAAGTGVTGRTSVAAADERSAYMNTVCI